MTERLKVGIIINQWSSDWSQNSGQFGNFSVHTVKLSLYTLCQ